LTPLLASSEGAAAFVLRFGRDEQHRPVIVGSVEANLSLICQRCLQPMDLPVRAEIGLGAVRGLEEAAALPESLDPLLVDDDSVRLRDIVEDELIMAVPAIARHEEDECQLALKSEEEDRTEDSRAENPFAVLASLNISSDDAKR
jgi:uncharacterized protein